MIKVKIGQEVTASEEYTFESTDGEIKTVKKNDNAFIDSVGRLHYVNGENIGVVEVPNSEFDFEGYDHKNISKMIYKILAEILPIEEYTTENIILKEMEEVLTKVL